MKHETIEAAVAASAPKIMYGGASASGLSFILSNEFMGVVGCLIALAGYLTNLYYKRKRDKREQEEHAARMGLYS